MRTQNEMKAMEKQVYNFLVSKANEHGYYIFNQLAYSRKYGVSEKTVRRITQRLVDKGAIINHGPGVSENVVYGSLGIIVEIKNHKPPKPTTDSNVTDELPPYIIPAKAIDSFADAIIDFANAIMRAGGAAHD